MKIVKVIWRDIASISTDSAWMPPEKAALEGWKLWDREHYSVGIVAYEAPEFIILAATWDGEDFADCSMIPRSIIKKVKVL